MCFADVAMQEFATRQVNLTGGEERFPVPAPARRP